MQIFILVVDTLILFNSAFVVVDKSQPEKFFYKFYILLL